MSNIPDVKQWIRTTARVGLGARAVVYLLISALLVRALLAGGGNGNEASPSSAFLAIEKEWWGRTLLLCIGAGLLLYTAWRIAQGVLDLDRIGDSAKDRLARLGMLASGIGYGLVAFAAFSVALDRTDSAGGGSTQETVDYLIRLPFGSWLVLLMGLIVGGIGAAQVWRGATGRWKKRLCLDDRTRPLEWLSGYAITGRGVLFLVAAASISWAGFSINPDEALGLAETMGWLRRQPFGFWLYLASGLVIGAYGAYSALQAWRYLPGADFTTDRTT